MKTRLLKRRFYYVTPIVSILLTLNTALCLHISFAPNYGAFLVRNSEQQSPQDKAHSFYLHRGCPAEVGQTLTVALASDSHSVRLTPHLIGQSNNSTCGISVNILTKSVEKQRPFVDALVFVDQHYLRFYGDRACVTVFATMRADSSTPVAAGRCVVSSADPTTAGGACLARIAIPLQNWPLQQNEDSIKKKQAKVFLSFAYSAQHGQSTNAVCSEMLTTEPLVDLAQVHTELRRSSSLRQLSDQLDVELKPVTVPMAALRLDKTADWMLTALVPKADLRYYPNSVFSMTLHFDYFIDASGADGGSKRDNIPPLYLFQIKCFTATRGIRVVSVENITADSEWSVHRHPDDSRGLAVTTIDVFHRHRVFLNESWSGDVLQMTLQITDDTAARNLSLVPIDISVEYFLGATSPPAAVAAAASAVGDDEFALENSTWSSSLVSVLPPAAAATDVAAPTSTSAKVAELFHGGHLISKGQPNAQIRFTIEKDGVDTVTPVAKTYELVNTAVLSGRQLVETIKVLAVSHAGVVTDETLSAQCSSSDNNALKVSPSCVSAYFDGSEIRGSFNVTISAIHKGRQGSSSFVVWYPELPLDISLSDPVLNAVKDWRLPSKKKLESREKESVTKRNKHRRKRAQAEQLICRAKYQDAEVRLFTRFWINDKITGKRTYMGGLGRQLQFDVTDVGALMVRSEKETVARVTVSNSDGRLMVNGVRRGHTNILLKSSHLASGHDLGASALEVSNEEVSVKSLTAQPLSAIGAVIKRNGFRNQAVVWPLFNRTFSKKYDKGWMRLTIRYSDDMTGELGDVPMTDAAINAWSRDEKAVVVKWPTSHSSLIHSAAAPQQATSYIDLQVLILSDDGGGTAVDFELRPPGDCQKPDGTPLASTTALVETLFAYPKNRNSPAEKGDDDATKQYDDYRNIMENIGDQFVDHQDDRAKVDDDVVYQRTADNNGAVIQRSPPVRNGEDGMDARRITFVSPSSNVEKTTAERTKRKASPFGLTLIILLSVFTLFGLGMGMNCLAKKHRENSPYKFQRLVPTVLTRWAVRRSQSTAACQEWVWMSKDQLEGNTGAAAGGGSTSSAGDNSLNSRYSRNSTLGMYPGHPAAQKHSGGGRFEDDRNNLREYIPYGTTNDGECDRVVKMRAKNYGTTTSGNGYTAFDSVAEDNTRSVSYRGSEVSIFISPQPCMQVHERTTPDRRAASWGNKARPRVRITANPMADSSSEQNLSTIAPTEVMLESYGGGFTTRSDGGGGGGDIHWDSASLGMNEAELQDYFSGLRESIA